MRRRLPTLLCRYEPRLLSRSTTILKPSSKTCSSIVWRTFAGAIAFSVSLFGVRFRVEGVSVRTGAILIQDRNLLRERGQREHADVTLFCLALFRIEICSAKMPDENRWERARSPSTTPSRNNSAFRQTNPARDRTHVCRR